jgi:hypothetical protein
MDRSTRKTHLPPDGVVPRAGAVVIALPPASARPPRAAVPVRPARVLHQLAERRDALQNEEWDRLAELVERAWVWRDPESVAEIETCLAALKRRLLTPL